MTNVNLNTDSTPDVAGAYLEEHAYDSFPKPVPFYIVRCNHASHGPIALNSGHHYREEAKHHAELLIVRHNAEHVTEEDVRAAEEAIWNADPSIPEADKFHAEEVYEDEDTFLTPGIRARECARSRDFIQASPHTLAADYAKHGNAWPFSGDHLNTVDVREEHYTPGVGWESGDVIGRARR